MAAKAISENYYKEQLDSVTQENGRLKERLMVAEKTNRDLLRSLNEFYVRQCTSAGTLNLRDVLSKRAVAEADTVENTLPVTAPSSVGNGPRDGAGKGAGKKFEFTYKYEIKRHAGAVYTVAFSNCGRFLASGSFDKTVQISDLSVASQAPICLAEHTLNVSDLSWSIDSSFLLSGAYDQTVKEWDVETHQMVISRKASGFVQSVMLGPSENQIFAVATTHKQIEIFDRRAEGVALALPNQCMVNTVLLLPTANTTVMSGDAAGMLKTWDVRMQQCTDAVRSGDSGKPISYMSFSLPAPGDVEGRLLAVNSYDNVLRVYDRGPKFSELSLLHELYGHSNQNWPIKNTFCPVLDASKKRWMESTADDLSVSNTSQSDRSETNKKSLLLATGSADNYGYIFDVSGPQGSSELIQRLEGHSDRVYAITCNRIKPLLASCSSDGNIRIWTP